MGKLLKLVFSIVLCMTFVSCEEITEVTNVIKGNAIAIAAQQGYIVEVHDDFRVEINGEVYGILDVKETKHSVATCNIFGYPWLCTLTGSKGRAIAKEASGGGPVSSDFANYIEVPSEEQPTDMTSTTYFSKSVYPNYGDTSVNYNAMRADVATWDPPGGWVNARVDWCEIDHPLFCNQD